MYHHEKGAPFIHPNLHANAVTSEGQRFSITSHKDVYVKRLCYPAEDEYVSKFKRSPIMLSIDYVSLLWNLARWYAVYILYLTLRRVWCISYTRTHVILLTLLPAALPGLVHRWGFILVSVC